MLETRIARVDETFVLTDRGTTQRVTRVTYFVGENGPFTADFTPAEWIPENVSKLMKDQAEKLEALGIK